MKGFSDDAEYGRSAVEDKTREINIALLDGGGLGVLQTMDIGEYRILPRTREERQRKNQKEALRRQGFSDDTTTDESDSEDGEEERPDERQETLFAEGEFKRLTFFLLPLTDRPSSLLSCVFSCLTLAMGPTWSQSRSGSGRPKRFRSRTSEPVPSFDWLSD